MATETERPDEDLAIYERWTRTAMRDSERVYRGLFYVTVIFFLVVMLFPFYWLFVLAVTPNDLIINMGVLPRGFNVAAFIEVFEMVPFHRYVFNSFVLALSTTAIVLLIGSLAGYVFGRLEFPGRQPLMLLILAISYFPPAAFLLPLFQLFTGNVEIFGIQSPQLFNTPGAMVLPFSSLFMPLAIFILATFYSQIPDGLEDAARVEGSTRLGALFRVIMPLSAPGVATAGILTFIAVYNEFFFSFIMNDGQWQNWAPLVWGILRYQGEFSQFYNLMAAASIIGVLPVVVIVVIAQEKIVSGLTAGALKE